MIREKVIHTLSVIMLFFSIFVCYGEIFSLLKGVATDVAIVHTPLWVKGIKDVGFLILSILGLLFFKYTGKRILGLLIYFGFIGILFGLSYLHNDLLILSGIRWILPLSGIRWILPLTACILIYPFINKALLVKLAYCLLVVFCFHFLVQFLQIYYRMGLDITGLKNKGLVTGFLDRAPGIFFMPNTASFFSILTWFFVSYFIPDKRIHKLKYLIPISIILNKSGTGYVAFLCIIIFERISKISWKVVAGAIFASFLALLGLQHLFKRPDIILTSMGDRISIFLNSFSEAELFSTQFGYGSITAVLLARNFRISKPVPILDSTWSAVVVNCGIVPFLIMGAFLLFFAYVSYRKNRKDILIFLFILFCYGSTNSLFEAFPMNYLCSLLGIYYFMEIKPEMANYFSRISVQARKFQQNYLARIPKKTS